MSHEQLFARNIPFTGGETQGTRGPLTEDGSHTAESSTAQHPTSSTPRRDSNQSIPAQPNAPSLGIVNELERIMEQFRDKQITKARAVALLTSKLNFNVERDEPEKEAALNQYLLAIESTDRLSSQAAQRGLHAAVGLRGLPNGESTTALDQPLERSATASDKEAEIIRAVGQEQSGKRRRVSSTSDSEEDIAGEDGESEGLSNKKKRLFERDMPWFQRESTSRQTANPSCSKTREILTQFAGDYNIIKHWINVSHSAPHGFPAAEWENIIKGRLVNLDSVLSSLHHISPVKENVGRVGSTEISLGRTEPSRKVKTSGEWTSAWNATIKATSFAFPHREDELREYGDYMDREFSSKVVSAHRKLILYDEAVRGEVAGGQKILLTNRHHFSYIYSAIVMPDGIESEFGKSSTSTSGPGVTKPHADICRRFNSTAQCPNTATTCRYRHICSKCKRSGHSKPDCSESREGKTSQKPSS